MQAGRMDLRFAQHAQGFGLKVGAAPMENDLADTARRSGLHQSVGDGQCQSVQSSGPCQSGQSAGSHQSPSSSRSPSKRGLGGGSCTYHPERVLGHGAFGVVCQAQVAETGETVAIKKVLQDKRYKNRELQIMKELRHPNVIELKHAFYTSGDKQGETYLNVVMEYCSDTVHRVIKHYGKTNRPVPLWIVQLYSYQMCRGCAYIHMMGICHRDLKPQNLLVDGKTHSLKIADFGSSKRLQAGEPNLAYICSRYYRAPELIFGKTDYTTVIDIWSVGCVSAELVLGHPIFRGENSCEQLVEIVKVLGTPTREELEAMSPGYTEFKFPQLKPRPWHKVFRGRTTEDAIDFISKLLVYAPEMRPSGLECCTHYFFDPLRERDSDVRGDGKALPDCLLRFSKEEVALMDAEMEARLIPDFARHRLLSKSRCQ